MESSRQRAVTRRTLLKATALGSAVALAVTPNAGFGLLSVNDVAAASVALVGLPRKSVPAHPAAAEPIAPTTPVSGYVEVQADHANTGVVFIGGPGVTVDTGIALYPGDGRQIPIADPAGLYCVADGAGQVLSIMVLREASAPTPTATPTPVAPTATATVTATTVPATATPTATATSASTTTPSITPAPSLTPTLAPGATNLAAAANGGRIAGYSSSYGYNWAPTRLIDGSASTAWASANGQTANQWVTVELANSGTYNVDRIRLNPAAIGGAAPSANTKRFNIAVSTTDAQDASFTPVFATPVTVPRVNSPLEFTFNPTPARYVKLVAVENYGSSLYIEAAELEVYAGAISLPTPTATPTLMPPTATPTAILGDTTGRVQLYRKDTNNFLVRIPIQGVADTVAEWTMQKITAPLAGWGFASGGWFLNGMQVSDLSGVAPPVVISRPGANYAFEYALLIGRAGDPKESFGYLGSLHQSERATAVSITADGVDAGGLAVGTTLLAYNVVFNQGLDHYLPLDKATVIGRSSVTHTFSSQYLEVEHSHGFNPGYEVYSFYSAMLPTTGGGGTGINTYQIGSNPPTLRTYDGLHHNRGTHAGTAAGWNSSSHPYRVELVLPSGGPDVNGDWSHTGVYGMWFLDSTPAEDKGKFYVNWVSSDYNGRIPAGSSSHRTRYLVARE